MPLVCLGLSHQTAPVDVRERHAFPAARMVETLVALRDYELVREAAMLATCGRIEIYADVADYEGGVEQLTAFLRNFRHGDVQHDMSSYMYTLLGAQAVEHLLRVATGLDSQVIGEAEILGQVKDAYVAAQRAGSLGPALHALFREALEAGKAARTRTAIGGDSVSIATAAIEFAKRRHGTLAGKTVLVIGAGKMGSLAAKRLRAEGCSDILMANRSTRAARDVIGAIGTGDVVDMPALVDGLARSDIVIASTGATEFVVTPSDVAAAMSARPDRPLVVVDIAVPRDADPEIARVAGVTLADIDALRDVVDRTLERRRAEIPAVEEIVAEHAKRFARRDRAQTAVPAVRSLVEKAEGVREAEIARLFARCPELSERERMLITGASLTIVSKLLHGLVTKLRDTAADDREAALELAATLDHLFDLGVAKE